MFACGGGKFEIRSSDIEVNELIEKAVVIVVVYVVVVDDGNVIDSTYI